jgi:colicin import membrane protein
MLGRFWKVFNNARAIVLAVIVHVIVLGILVVNMEWLDVKPSATPKASPIQTQTVDRQFIERELARAEAEKKRKQAETKKEQQRIEKEKRRLADLEKKRKAEEKRQNQLAEKKKHEAKQKQQAEIKRKQAVADKKKREAEVKKKAEAEKKRKLAAEQQRKEEAVRKQKIAAETEKKRKAQQQALAEQRRQKERENALLMQIEAEENASETARLRAMIQTDVQNNYYIPPTARKGMQCTMEIRLFPSGEVQSVTITQSSGDRSFDKAAEDAVFRASPLPVSLSSAGKLFNRFRVFNFIFKPDI